VEQILSRTVAGPYGGDAKGRPQSPVSAGVATGTARQLDLLSAAEAKSYWIRQRHAEQVNLITDIELLVIAALRLGRVAAEQKDFATLPVWVRQRLQGIYAECARLRHALEERRPPVGQALIGRDSSTEGEVADAETLALFPSIHVMEQSLSHMPEVMAFLALSDTSPSSAQPTREPVAEQHFFTPACTLSNWEAIHFALKGTLAASICGLLYQGIAWPGIHTCVYTCVTISQSYVGAGLRKALLRFTGATVGGLTSLFVIVSLTPTMTNLASFLVVTTTLLFAAAWVTTGSSRISYAGYQMAIATALLLLNGFAPPTDLTPGRDRLVGILLGVIVMGAVDNTLWPVFVRSTIRQKLVDMLHKIAILQRLVSQKNRAQARTTSFAIHRDLTNTLSLQDVLLLEPDLPQQEAEGEHNTLLQLINHVQRVFLKLLALGRHRAGMNLDSMAQPVVDRMHELDEAIAKTLEALGDSLESRQGVVTVDIDHLFSGFEEVVKSHSGQGNSYGPVEARLREYVVLYREFLASLAELNRDIQAAAEEASEGAGLGRYRHPAWEGPET